ncbi:FAD binding domain-containing protein [Ruminococcus sp.]|uniref:FAD binding domain-containing protein n=1 Tax=Ruminococcus sp. TaxID=41978 RepID=UPI002E80EF60|nr:FAD binding domain-containing protein [Ruminococcus sp.]MEE3493366.1 FAD binding domain-containing protein [Ruminococcus sp.]
MVNGYKPTTLQEAVEIKSRTDAIPYAGGTDLMVKNIPGAVYLFVNDIEELRQIKQDDAYIRIGAAVTFTQALADDLIPPLMKEAISRIAAPAIRNAGTFGGNLGNASDKADSVLAGFALDARVRLVSVNGERTIPFDDFCVRRGVTNIGDDELIAEILLPKEKCALPYYYKKIGGRSALAISRVAFAGAYEVCDGVIKAISATVIGEGKFTRYREVEATLIGRKVDEVRVNAEEYAERFIEKMTFTRGRVSAEYRKTVVTNLFKDYLTSLE